MAPRTQPPKNVPRAKNPTRFQFSLLICLTPSFVTCDNYDCCDCLVGLVGNLPAVVTPEPLAEVAHCADLCEHQEPEVDLIAQHEGARTRTRPCRCWSSHRPLADATGRGVGLCEPCPCHLNHAPSSSGASSPAMASAS